VVVAVTIFTNDDLRKQRSHLPIESNGWLRTYKDHLQHASAISGGNMRLSANVMDLVMGPNEGPRFAESQADVNIEPSRDQDARALQRPLDHIR
jgi:hypothetical protein